MAHYEIAAAGVEVRPAQVDALAGAQAGVCPEEREGAVVRVAGDLQEGGDLVVIVGQALLSARGGVVREAHVGEGVE